MSIIINDYEDEIDSVKWLESPKHSIEIFNCGCCEECICDDQTICSNCLCSCLIENSDDSNDTNDTNDPSDVPISHTINDFTIDIIEDSNKERKVRINVSIELQNNKNITIKLDINRSLYLQIAEDLVE